MWSDLFLLATDGWNRSPVLFTSWVISGWIGPVQTFQYFATARKKKKKPRSTLSKHVPVIWYSQLEIVQICNAIRFKGPLTERGRWNTRLTRRADLITQRLVIYSREQLTLMKANCFYHSRNTVAGRMRKHPVSLESQFSQSLSTNQLCFQGP